MPWTIQNASGGPIVISDIGLTLAPGQIKDIDIIGRENGERSNDLKYLIQKGFVRQIGKGPQEPSRHEIKAAEMISSAVGKIEELAATSQEQAKSAQAVIEELRAKNAELEQRLNASQQQTAEVMTKADVVLSEVREFVSRFPLQARDIATAMRNIQAERAEISDKRQEMAKDDGHSDAEIRLQERILAIRDQKLEKNSKNLGSTISKSSGDVDAALDALDSLNL